MTRDVDLDGVIDQDFDDPRGGFDGQPRRRVAGLKVFVAGMMLLAMALIGYVLWQALGKTANDINSADQVDASDTSQARYQFSLTPPQSPESPSIEIPPPEPVSVPEPEPQRAHWRDMPAQEQAQGDDELTPQQQIMARRLSGFTPTGSGSLVDAAQAGGGSLMGGDNNMSDGARSFTDRLRGGKPARVQASVLENPSLTIPQGRSIVCGTTSELDTTVPGMVTCQVSHDVYSADGNVRLIDKGAQVTGLVDSGIQHGQARVFVAWHRLRNPDHVTIQLDSPGASALGGAGIPGQVDTKFWERFGNALVVSVLGDASEALFSHLADNSTNNSQTNINLNNTSRTVETLAQEALRANLDIPPTLYTPHGTPVVIHVAHDLDFSDVYGLEVR